MLYYEDVEPPFWLRGLKVPTQLHDSHTFPTKLKGFEDASGVFWLSFSHGGDFRSPAADLFLIGNRLFRIPILSSAGGSRYFRDVLANAALGKIEYCCVESWEQSRRSEWDKIDPVPLDKMFEHLKLCANIREPLFRLGKNMAYIDGKLYSQVRAPGGGAVQKVATEEMLHGIRTLEALAEEEKKAFDRSGYPIDPSCIGPIKAKFTDPLFITPTPEMSPVRPVAPLEPPRDANLDHALYGLF